MPNLSQVLKAEIARISRKEAKSFANPLRSSTVYLKKTVIELKRKVAALEAENKRLVAFNSKLHKQPQINPEEAKKARITSKGVHKLRAKLGLTQEGFAKLIGVSTQAVFGMEKKGGRLRLRSATLSNLLAIRGLGKREAKKRLEEISK